MPYSFILDEPERKELLRIARSTVKEHLVSGRTPPGAPHRESLLAPAGVFVSVHEGAELRGCIGTTAEGAPLYRAVQEMAVAAATRDPRFAPVRLEELPVVGFEISVLGGHTRVTSPDEVEIGVHGLIVAAGRRRGLLLPQVAVEHRWDAATLFAQTCEKAGLPADAWKSPDATIQRFTAQVFDEKTLRTGPFCPKVSEPCPKPRP